MRFRSGDELLGMDVVREGADLVTFTDGGFWKRTSLDEWTAKGRGGLGVVAMKLPEHRGVLVGALVIDEGDEVLAMTAGGGVIRTRVTESELQRRGRDTMGVRLIALNDGDAVIGVARNAETDAETDADAEGEPGVDAEGEPGVEDEAGDPGDAPEAARPAVTGDVGDAGGEGAAGRAENSPGDDGDHGRTEA
jgi:DNA gyrase subunit A